MLAHLFLFLSLISLIACDAGNYVAVKRAPNGPSYQEQSACAFSFEEGDQILSRAGDHFIQTYFNKNLNWGKLTPLLSASARESVVYIEEESVLIRTLPEVEQRCAMFSEVDHAPQWALNEWRELGNDLLGLYLEQYRPSNPRLADNAMIVIRQDTSRWTLIHEYLHHLFHSEAQASGLLDEVLIERAEAAYENDFIPKYQKIRNYLGKKPFADDPKFKEALDSLDRSFVLNLEVLKRYTLEEITIETLLMQLYQAKQLTTVPAVDNLGADEYIQAKAKEAIEVLKIFKSFYNAFGTNPNYLSKAQSKLKEIENLELEIQGLVKNANESRSLNSPEELHGLTQGPIEQHTRCSHGGKIKELIKTLQK